MAKKQREFTLVSALVGRIALDVSGGTEGKEDYVPPTKGFMIEVTYTSESAKMGKALSSTIIDVQNILRVFYRKNKKFPFAPGKLQKVSGDGSFELPVTSHVDRLKVALANNQIDMQDKIDLAMSMGLPIPQEWLDMAETTADFTADERNESTDEDNDDDMKYPKGSLNKTVIAKLKVIAQDEEIEGYDELTANEIREELYAIEK